MAKKHQDFSVFGTRPHNAIFLPDIPYSVRLNCKDGGLFVGGHEHQHRKSNPDQKIEVSIIKVAKFFGSLGLAKNTLWVQLFYIAAPSVPVEILPPNTVCTSYIKKQSISHLYNTVQEAMSHGEPGHGIFTLGFNREAGDKGTYYSVDWAWRERHSEEELEQLNLIKAFMNGFGDQLTDLEGSREMICIDGWPNEDIQAMIQLRQAQCEQGLLTS